MTKLPLGDILDTDVASGVELVVLSLFFGVIALTSLRLALTQYPRRERGKRYNDAGLDRLLHAVLRDAHGEEKALSDSLLEEAGTGGSQENWTLGERQAYYIANHPILWERRLSLSRHHPHSVPQKMMDLHFLPSPQEDIPRQER